MKLQKFEVFYVYLTFPRPVVTVYTKLFIIQRNLRSTRTVYTYLCLALNVEQQRYLLPTTSAGCFFWTCSQNYENGLLASSCLSAHLSVRMEQFSSPLEGFS